MRQMDISCLTQLPGGCRML